MGVDQRDSFIGPLMRSVASADGSPGVLWLTPGDREGTRRLSHRLGDAVGQDGHGLHAERDAGLHASGELPVLQRSHVASLVLPHG